MSGLESQVRIGKDILSNELNVCTSIEILTMLSSAKNMFRHCAPVQWQLSWV